MHCIIINKVSELLNVDCVSIFVEKYKKIR